MRIDLDIAMCRRVAIAVRSFRSDRGRYPASLEEEGLQAYLDERLAAFLREGSVGYFPPGVDSPPTFVVMRLATPRGDYDVLLDGTRLRPRTR